MKLYATVQLALLAALAVAGIFLWRYLQVSTPLEIARDLKEKTPLGIPARAIDSGITAATGREETLGGWFAELFDPATRAANAMLRSPLPHDNLQNRDVSRPWAL